MSDPIFLRNLINNTVYAEQIHSAQQMAHEAAREKNIRVQQQKIQEQALAVDKLDESAGLQVGEEGNREKSPGEQSESESKDAEEGKSGTTESESGGMQRIDITV
jgi:thiol:disulfide interchange protein